MRTVFSAIVAAALISFASPARAIDRVITIEGPVEVVTSTATPERTVYWVETPQNERYQIVIPESERARFTTVIEQTPAPVIRFDGTVTDDEAGRRMNVTRWDTTTKTTTLKDSLGTTKVIEERTTTYGK